jgi:hypothetical protein
MSRVDFRDVEILSDFERIDPVAGEPVVGQPLAGGDGSDWRDVIGAWIVCIALFAGLALAGHIASQDRLPGAPPPITSAQAHAPLHLAAPAPLVHG